MLERLRVSFITASPNVDEQPLAGEAPRATALRLAESKARAVAQIHPGTLVIGSDQIAVLRGQPIGKPGTREAALDQLLSMRGEIVVFHTALCLFDGRSGNAQLDEVPTTVRMRSFSRAAAEHYLTIDQPYDCAGSAKIESLGVALTESVESRDPTALIGLPLIALVTMLDHAGVDVLRPE